MSKGEKSWGNSILIVREIRIDKNVSNLTGAMLTAAEEKLKPVNGAIKIGLNSSRNQHLPSCSFSSVNAEKESSIETTRSRCSL